MDENELTDRESVTEKPPCEELLAEPLIEDIPPQPVIEDTSPKQELPGEDTGLAQHETLPPPRGTAYEDPFFNVPPVLGDLEGLDKEAFWNSVAAVRPQKQKRKKPSVSLIILCFLMLLFMTGILFTVINGKGWLIRLINGGKNIEFTLPVEEKPQLESTAYQEDGRYTVEGVAEAVLPSTVKIEVYTSEMSISASGWGSGIIMTEDGFILTNAHVIENAAKIKVMLDTREEYSASVIGSDAPSDIAVLKINKSGLKPAQFGDSDQVKLGEDCVVIGSPAGFFGSVTKGIVSGTDRMIKVESYSVPMRCLQVDAAINPGNSGGALVNMWGQVVGITSSKLASRTYYGIGFAISMSAAKPIIEEIMAKGYVEETAKIGIVFYSISSEDAEDMGIIPGILIAGIDKSCDISNTELSYGDIITSLNGKRIMTAEDVKELLRGCKPGDTMTATVFRKENEEDEGRMFNISFKLESDRTSIVEKES